MTSGTACAGGVSRGGHDPSRWRIGTHRCRSRAALPPRTRTGRPSRDDALYGDKKPLRTTVRLPITEFDMIVRGIARAVRAGHTIDPVELLPLKGSQRPE